MVMYSAYNQKSQRGTRGMIAPLELDFQEDRYSRFRLISWWDQDILRNSKIMVVGAGALGNEILKSLALLGVGEVIVVDLDRIENSNLSRSVLYRAGDEGKFKAEIAAERVREINPDVQVRPMVANIVSGVGLGWFSYVDLVIGGLDNREARMAINQKCWLTDRPWVDGAIEVLHGIARVFVPGQGACYECTLTEQDYILLNQRRSCALLSRDEMLAGKTPTTPTSASIIAGIQVQEAIKLLHNSPDLPTLAGKGFFFNGLTHDSYLVDYQFKEDCMAHDTMDQVIPIPGATAEDTTLGQLLEFAQQELGDGAILELGQEVVTNLHCAQCDQSIPVFRCLYAVTEGESRCSACGEVMIPSLIHRITGEEDYLDLSLAAIGIPPWDIVEGRFGSERRFFELAGDRPLSACSKGA